MTDENPSAAAESAATVESAAAVAASRAALDAPAGSASSVEPAAAAPAPSVADGELRQLDPNTIHVERAASWIFTAVVVGGLSVALLASLFGPLWRTAVLGAVLVGIGGFLAWWSHRWPAIAYRHTFYRVDREGIEIRRGVVWRHVVNVPRSRVQHTDVSQGPLQRGYSLGTLVVYTAGVDHAKVELPGLPHERALRMRDHLLPTGPDDAV